MSIYTSCADCDSPMLLGTKCTHCGPRQMVRLSAVLAFLRSDEPESKYNYGCEGGMSPKDWADLLEAHFTGKKEVKDEM